MEKHFDLRCIKQCAAPWLTHTPPTGKTDFRFKQPRRVAAMGALNAYPVKMHCATIARSLVFDCFVGLVFN